MDFEDIILNYEKMIYAIAWRIMGNCEDAQDVAQEVAIKIYRNMSKCCGEEFLGIWISRITRNTCIDALRRRKDNIWSLDEVLETDDGQMQAQLPDPSLGPEALLLKQEVAVQIESALDELSAPHRAVLVLRDIQGHSYTEVMEITGLRLGTVKSMLFRGRTKLKKILS